ncbi:MAG TPA: hypothetical protein VK102_08005 [Sphingobacterium sp.]|nr:hypothetical protein [Sphingobacterium sp.]
MNSSGRNGQNTEATYCQIFPKTLHNDMAKDMAGTACQVELDTFCYLIGGSDDTARKFMKNLLTKSLSFVPAGYCGNYRLFI